MGIKMTIGQGFLQELTLEAAVTRRYLASVPFDKLDFQPTEKSEKLGRLAVHVAEIVAWWKSCVEADKLDFMGFEPKEFTSSETLLAYFDGLLAEATKALSEVKNAEFKKKWSMTHGEEVYFTLPKKQVARLFCMNHWVHHRAQLGVYLRLLGVAVPATYGPSADDFEMILTNKFS